MQTENPTTRDDAALSEAMGNLSSAFAISDMLMSLNEGGQLNELADATLPLVIHDLWSKIGEAKRSLQQFADSNREVA